MTMRQIVKNRVEEIKKRLIGLNQRLVGLNRRVRKRFSGWFKRTSASSKKAGVAPNKTSVESKRTDALPTVTWAPDKDFIAVLKNFGAQLDALMDPLEARPRHVPDGNGRKWRKHIPELAASCAGVMDNNGELFTSIDFTAQDLRDLKEDVFRIQMFVILLGKAYKTACRILMNRKQELCDKTMKVADQVRTLKKLPAVTEEMHQQAVRASAEIEGILDESNAKVQAKRKKRVKMRKKNDAPIEELKLQREAGERTALVLNGGQL